MFRCVVLSTKFSVSPCSDSNNMVRWQHYNTSWFLCGRKSTQLLTLPVSSQSQYDFFISFVRAVSQHAVARLLRRCYRTNPRKSSEQWSCPLQASTRRQSLVTLVQQVAVSQKTIRHFNRFSEQFHMAHRKQIPWEIYAYNCVRFNINPSDYSGNFMYHLL